MTQTSQEAGQPEEGIGERRDRVVIVTPEGMAVSGTTDDERSPTELIEQPAKVMRIGSMIKQLLEEVRSAPLDEAGRLRLAEVHDRSIKELEQGLAPELVDELRRITEGDLKAKLVRIAARPQSVKVQEGGMRPSAHKHHPKARQRKPTWRRSEPS